MDLGLGSPLDIVSALVGAGAQIATPFVAAANAPPAAQARREEQLDLIQAEAASQKWRTLLIVGGLVAGAAVVAFVLLRRKS